MNHLDHLASLCLPLGEDILKIQAANLDVNYKTDDSPVTKADLLAHEQITKALHSLESDIPVISEEMSDDARAKLCPRPPAYWLVDPLDGTKEFIRQSPDFTINIARMEMNQPILSIIHVPAHKRTFAAALGWGCFERLTTGEWSPVESNFSPEMRTLFVHSHRDNAEDIQALINLIPNSEAKPCGSSLKFCLLAAGEAHIYVRNKPTMEWDTAAGELIVKEAGGAMVTNDLTHISYDRKDFENPRFVAMAGSHSHLQDVLIGHLNNKTAENQG